jgi:hypothetical protein
MKVPNIAYAQISYEKIVLYLLNVDHQVGRGKAMFFIRFGFSVAEWEQLAWALMQHGLDHEVVARDTTRFGTRYVVEGPLNTPSNREPNVRVVWLIPNETSEPRLITAYPIEE